MNYEKTAKELVEKFKQELSEDDSSNQYGKECALICVDKIIEELEMLRKPEYTTFIAWEQLKEKEEADTWDGYERQEFWQKVKEAIYKL